MSQVETYDSKEVLLSVRGIFKTFGLNAVLKGINLDVGRGGVLALTGGNGTGKNTLVKIIMGIYRSDGRELVVTDERIHSFKPSVILARGVYTVPQEPMLFPSMTVEKNVLIGPKEKTRTLRKRLLQIMGGIGWHLDLNRKAMSLSITEQQLVELLRGLLRSARVLILDEPTSAFTFDEIESLFKIVEDLKQKGIGIVYIAHRLAEVFQVAIHVAIMRDGIITLKGRVSGFTREMLVKGFLPPSTDVADLEDGRGEEKALNYEGLKPVFELQGYVGYDFEDISSKVYPGEVLEVAGVTGAGHTELTTAIFGRDKVLRGKAVLDGRDITGCSTAQILEAGISYMPEDQRLNGLFVISDVAANTTSSLLRDKEAGGFFLSKKAEKEVASRYIDDFRVEVTEQDQATRSLSGGNQQKIITGRSLSTNPKLVILGEPTRGIDTATRGDVYSIIHELKARGVVIMLISSDMEEIVELSDRVVVVFSRRIKGELTRVEISRASLMTTPFDVTEE